MSQLNTISYLVFSSNRHEEWRRFGSDFLGMEVYDHDDGSLRLRMDDHAYRFIVAGGESENLLAVGFEVNNAQALADFEAHLLSQNVEVHRATALELASRQVGGLIWFTDPQGLRLEVVCNPRLISKAPHMPLIPQGFVTGNQGFGHIAITAADLPIAEAFYQQTLGFLVSDYIEQPIQGFSVKFTFYHINPRHHTLALAGVPMLTRLHHFMVQVQDTDTVGQALERAKKMGIPIHMALGRHPNDRMLSFYAKTPSDFNVEFGCEGLEINDEATWQVKTYDAISEWGHKL